MRKHKFILYVLVGATSYLVEMGSLCLLNIVFGLPDVAAVAISFWVGFIVAFVLQKWVTFKSHSKAVHVVTRQLVAYGVLAAWNYGFTLATVALFSSVLSVFIIRTIAIAIITMWNFAIYSLIFKEVPTKSIES